MTESHESLEDERDFLLRSLDDLDSELLVGNIDPDTYRVLHDDYTARAAAVIKSIADGVDRTKPGAQRSQPMLRAITYGGIVVFALIAAFLLAHAVGQRRSGQEITGDAQAGGATNTTISAAAALQSAQAAAAAQPNSYAARINYARTLLSSGDYPDSVKEFVAASNLDPKQPEPLAYAGWLTVLVSRQVTAPATKQQLLDAAASSLDQAISADPTYPDSYVFKGLMLAQDENKECAGATALQQFLVTAPTDHPMRPLVLSALADAVKTGKCPSPPTTPTTKP